MPIVRDPNLPQHDLGSMHYGELPLAGLPSGTQTGQVFVWINATQEFKRATLTGISGIAVNVDPDTGSIELSLSDRIVADDFLADAIIKATTSGTATANSIIKKTVSATFTADAVLQ